MLDIIAKEILVESFKFVIEKVLKRVETGFFDTIEKKTKLTEALTSINQAILETKNFIKNEGYLDNTGLSKMWHDALNKSVAAGLNDGLPEYLYHKADFWGEPKEWLENKSNMEIVPKLNELKLLCDTILVRITK